MKHLQDLGLVVVAFATFFLIGFFIHTLATYKHCDKEFNCSAARKDKGKVVLSPCDFKVCNVMPSDEVLNSHSKAYEPPTPQGLR